MKAWILTVTYNDYDQHGDYFVAWWKDKPSLEELKQSTEGFSDNELKHVLQGGGRIDDEYKWYNLIEIEEGVVL